MTYINSPMNYTGSKFKLLDQILPHLDYSKDYFIDLFCGSGVVAYNVLDKYKKLLINDILSELIGIHENLNDNASEFIESVKELAKTKQNQALYNQLRESFNQEKTPEKLYALMLTCNNNIIRYNQKGVFNQTWGKREFNDSIQKKLNIFVEHIAKYSEKIYYASRIFNEIMPTKPSMVYLDAPYGMCMDEKGDITNNQVSLAGYNRLWFQKDDIKLYEYILKLDKNKHSFMLSGVLEHDGKMAWITNKLISDKFNYEELDFNYNGVSHKGDKETVEVIIMNY